MYELLLKEFVDCLLWSPSRSLRIACIKQTLLVFIIKYNFPEFWCHCVCRVHVCTENRTRFRHCPAGSHSQVGTLSQNNTFLLHWDTFLLLFNTCWIIPFLYGWEPSISTMSGSQYGISVCTCTLFSRGFTTWMELSSLFFTLHLGSFIASSICGQSRFVRLDAVLTSWSVYNQEVPRFKEFSRTAVSVSFHRSLDAFGLHPQCGFWIYFGICTCSRCHYWYQCIIFYGGFCRNCLFLASNRYRWFLQSSWTWSYFVGHTVRCIHLCFSVWTRIRYCYAITCCSFGTDSSCFFKDLGEKRRNNIWLLLCVIFLAWCNICWIIRISRSGAKYFDNVGVPVWDPSLHPFYALQLHFNENGTSQCHFLHLLGIVLYIIDTLTIVFCWFLTIVESYHIFRFLEFTILFCSHFVGSGCWTGGIRFPPWYVATDYHFGITLKQTFTIYAKC